ncbi:endonuclease/exonuclease/phosphatase family protein [Tamlana sp. 2201CG12-4]|uniref:endonuclease/exonuclease/phosphatase family protein n=1 Tax=Tamlana sp. 2201CG12-4 TaxID=3112582 RepID=UPI002DBCBFEF|nr:endonuclease/exonuclease/phosphatase family protein [Tamlana sp. 2201CG12-4]MEC3907049.1 endonuclease/exonuclease/phosphatase family protein [Tamlana sp. 2201CG12-4]
MKKSSFYVFLILLSLVIKSCDNKTNKALTFLTFNVWQEGTSVPNGLNKIRDVILKTNPDIVCFVEVRNYQDEDWTSKIVNILEKSGKHYYSGYAGGDVSFISKYPLENGKQIFKNKDKGTVVNFNLNVDGNIIIVSGAHLDYTYYASNLPRGYNGGDPDWKMIDDGNGKPAPYTILDSVQAYNLKSTRDEAISAFIESVKPESKPVILMGDFNEPSFLDWTRKTKNMFDHNGLIMPWYNTKKLHEAGFIDTFRTFFPNEVANPGFTWPSFAHEKTSTSWAPLADERDRVDYIFFRGNDIKIKDVCIVGPKESYVYNTLETLNTDQEQFIANQLPWPSDHKAVYAKLVFTFKNKND